MKFLAKSDDLVAALNVISTSMAKTLQDVQLYQEPQDHFDAMFYDNFSMCKHLHVSERTLQRYRKSGKIKSTIIKGKVYYPKNFMVSTGEAVHSGHTTTNYCEPDPHKEVIPQAKTRPRSKIIDLHRLKEKISQCKWEHRRYDNQEVCRIRKLFQKARYAKCKNLHLWPKKIKLVSLPFKKPKKMCFHP